MTVVHQREVLENEVINVCFFWIKLQKWKGVWIPFKLFSQRLNMIRVDMGVTEGVNELTSLEATNLGKHAC